MPDDEAKLPLFNLENNLRMLGQEDKSFVIGVFDCCREPYNERSQSLFKHMATRGGNEETKEEVEGSNNLFLIFGCPPQKTVPGESKIVP